MSLVTEVDIRVRNPDQDSQGWVNNARFVEYFGEGRLDHMDRLLGQIPVPGTFTLAEVLVQYRAPARHRDLLHVRVWTREIRTRSFTLPFEIVKADTDQLVAQGHSVQVWLTDGAPAPIPEALRQVLERSMEMKSVAKQSFATDFI